MNLKYDDLQNGGYFSRHQNVEGWSILYWCRSSSIKNTPTAVYALTSSIAYSGKSIIHIHQRCFIGTKSILRIHLWWRHERKTFYALPGLCEGNPLVIGGFPSQRSERRSFDVFFELLLNKRFSKQSRCRWFETSSRPLWRYCNECQWSDLDGHG